MSKDTDNSTSTANRMFLLSLLPDLNSMSPTEIRLFKREVLLLTDNILTNRSSSSTSQVPTANSEQRSQDFGNKFSFIQTSTSQVPTANGQQRSQDFGNNFSFQTSTSQAPTGNSEQGLSDPGNNFAFIRLVQETVDK